MTMRIFLGYDSREAVAYAVASASITRRAGAPRPEALDEQRLRSAGMFWRPVDRRGRMYDIVSGAEQSTEFAITRFIVPLLVHTGWALFADSDVVFLRDPRELLHGLADPTKAVQVVKHQHEPSTSLKMDGQSQVAYPRKNWSSVMLFNCEHAAHRRLSLSDINTRTGRELHAFYWLHDSEIGELPPEWNWLVGEQEKPKSPAVAHFTLGGPFLPSWGGAEHDDIWHEAAKAIRP